MCALSRPVSVHCATNIFCDRRAIDRVTHSDSGTVATVIRVSSGEIVSIITVTAMMERTAVNNWAIVTEIEA